MKNKKFHFELLIRRQKKTLWVTNSKLENKKNNLELLTLFVPLSSYLLKVEKYLTSFQVTNSMVKISFFRIQVTNSRLKNKKCHF